MYKLKTQLSSLIIVTSLISNIAFADCVPAIDLKVGDKVSDCPRVGVRPDVLQDMDKQITENDFNKKIITEQTRIIDLKDLRIQESDKQANLWKEDSARERENFDKERNRSNTSFWVGLGAGLLLTITAAWTVKQVAR